MRKYACCEGLPASDAIQLRPSLDQGPRVSTNVFDVPSYACSNMRVQLLSLFVLPLLAFASMDEQMVLPSSQVGSGEPFAPVTHSGKPSLADLLTIDTSASIFYSYARELQLSEKFSESDEHITLLVPTNKAVIALPRKP